MSGPPPSLRAVHRTGEGLEVVAEGIERDEQATQLRNVNCDIVQGALFSPPLPPEAIASMIECAIQDRAAYGHIARLRNRHMVQTQQRLPSDHPVVRVNST